MIFQGGKKVDEADLQQGEPPWEEVSQLHAFIRHMLTTLIYGCDDDFVDGGNSSHPATALGGPSNAIGNANYDYFGRSQGSSHMYVV